MALKIDKIDVNDLIIHDPIKQDDLLIATITYRDKPLIVQLPKTVIHNASPDSITTQKNDGVDTFIQNYEEKLVDIIAEHTQSWFSKKLSRNDVVQLFKTNLHSRGGVTLKVDDNVKINDYNINDIKDKEGILLVHLSYLVFHKTACIPYCNTIQIKVKEPRQIHEFRDTSEPPKDPIKLKVQNFDF
jgi:hypothetical protein